VEDNKTLKKITDYLRAHPLASIAEVREKTKVEQATISRFIKAGSLKISQAKEMHSCRICGKTTKTGSICEDCASKIRGMNQKKPEK